MKSEIPHFRRLGISHCCSGIVLRSLNYLKCENTAVLVFRAVLYSSDSYPFDLSLTDVSGSLLQNKKSHLKILQIAFGDNLFQRLHKTF
jgi:hypothetical protein